MRRTASAKTASGQCVYSQQQRQPVADHRQRAREGLLHHADKRPRCIKVGWVLRGLDVRSGHRPCGLAVELTAHHDPLDAASDRCADRHSFHGGWPVADVRQLVPQSFSGVRPTAQGGCGPRPQGKSVGLEEQRHEAGKLCGGGFERRPGLSV